MMTQRPDLFRAIVCEVPLLDMIRYDQFGSGKTWIPEYGSPKDPAQFQALYAYSPYHHDKPGASYPSVLFCTAANDDPIQDMLLSRLIHGTPVEAPLFPRWPCASCRNSRSPARMGAERGVDIKEQAVTQSKARREWARHPRMAAARVLFMGSSEPVLHFRRLAVFQPAIGIGDGLCQKCWDTVTVRVFGISQRQVRHRRFSGLAKRGGRGQHHDREKWQRLVRIKNNNA